MGPDSLLINILCLPEQSTLLTNPREWNKGVPWPEKVVDYGAGCQKRKFKHHLAHPLH
jgi:hypothetical protein